MSEESEKSKKKQGHNIKHTPKKSQCWLYTCVWSMWVKTATHAHTHSNQAQWWVRCYLETPATLH